jgi:hypothetical protein
MVFVFHATLLAVPLFLNAYNILWDEAFGISLWSIPDIWADVMTLFLLGSAFFLAVRRIVCSKIHILTGAWDYVLLGLSVLPFLTGFLAYHHLAFIPLSPILFPCPLLSVLCPYPVTCAF